MNSGFQLPAASLVLWEIVLMILLHCSLTPSSPPAGNWGSVCKLRALRRSFLMDCSDSPWHLNTTFNNCDYAKTRRRSWTCLKSKCGLFSPRRAKHTFLVVNMWNLIAVVAVDVETVYRCLVKPNKLNHSILKTPPQPQHKPCCYKKQCISKTRFPTDVHMLHNQIRHWHWPVVGNHGVSRAGWMLLRCLQNKRNPHWRT